MPAGLGGFVLFLRSSSAAPAGGASEVRTGTARTLGPGGLGSALLLAYARPRPVEAPPVAVVPTPAPAATAAARRRLITYLFGRRIWRAW